jgi:DNA-binding NtrC family response regulator
MTQSASPGSGTLLIVDNEAPIRALLQAALEQNGFTVLAAESGREALELATAHPGPIDLLITDVVMPEMSGPELERAVVAVRPGLRTLFMSGYMDDALGQHGVLPAEVNFIQKPFSPRVMAQRVREILGGVGGRS